jgi:hypothetical protein
MSLSNILGDAFHAEDLDVEACAIRESIVDRTEVLLMNLGHVHAETTCRIEPSTTSFAFEVLRLLMIDEDLEVIEVAFAVVAPGSRKDFFDIGVVALFLRHRDECEEVRPGEENEFEP